MNIDNMTSYAELDDVFTTLKETIISLKETKIVDSYTTAFETYNLHTAQLNAIETLSDPEVESSKVNLLTTLAAQWKDQADRILADNPWIQGSTSEPAENPLDPPVVTIIPKPVFTLTADDEAYVAEAYASSRKELRAKLVAAIVVTTSNGKVFNGDEISQDRMTRAITALPNPTDTIMWTLADNTKADVAKTEFQEALALAGMAQTALW